jgi:uncharacterized protein DUF695
VPIFRKRSEISPFDVPDEWNVLRGEHDGRPMLVRVNVGLKLVTGHSEFGYQIGVAIPLNNPQENGWPTPQEDQELDAIEERLSRELEETHRAILAAVITTSGMREFVLYTRSRDWIGAWAPTFDAATERHKVQVMAQPDPEWSVFRRFTGA